MNVLDVSHETAGFFPHDESYEAMGSLTRVWDGASRAIRENLAVRGATAVDVTVWSWRDDPFHRKQVILDSEVFQSVCLDLEQINLVLTHLPFNATTEMAFVMAQAIESGLDIDVVFDPATQQLRTPSATRKAVAA